MGQCPALAYPMAARPNSTTVAPVQMRNAHPPASLPTSGPMVWEQRCARGEQSWARAVWPVARWGPPVPGRSLGRGTRAGQGTGRMNAVVLPNPAGADDEADASHRGQFAVEPCVQSLNQARARRRDRVWWSRGEWPSCPNLTTSSPYPQIERSPAYLDRASLIPISGFSVRSMHFDLHLHAHSPAQPRRLFVQLDDDCVHHIATDRVRLRRDVYHLPPNLHAQRFHVHGRLLSH